MNTPQVMNDECVMMITDHKTRQHRSCKLIPLDVFSLKFLNNFCILKINFPGTMVVCVFMQIIFFNGVNLGERHDVTHASGEDVKRR